MLNTCKNKRQRLNNNTCTYLNTFQGTDPGYPVKY